jgi:hypothetical protein
MPIRKPVQIGTAQTRSIHLDHRRSDEQVGGPVRHGGFDDNHLLLFRDDPDMRGWASLFTLGQSDLSYSIQTSEYKNPSAKFFNLGQVHPISYNGQR